MTRCSAISHREMAMPGCAYSPSGFLHPVERCRRRGERRCPQFGQRYKEGGAGAPYASHRCLDSEEDPAGMENHARRPEVRAARESKFGTATRYSSTVHQSMMYVAMKTEISIGLLGLQVVREGCHELITLRERRAGLLRSFPDEDLHPRKGAPSLGEAGTVQLIHRVASDVCDGVHAQERRMEALERIGWAEVLWLRIARGRVLGVAMVRHRCSQAHAWSSRMPSQGPSVLRSSWGG